MRLAKDDKLRLYLHNSDKEKQVRNHAPFIQKKCAYTRLETRMVKMAYDFFIMGVLIG